MSQLIRAIYEHGVFRPLEPVELAEQERVSLTVDLASDELLDRDAIDWAAQEGDVEVTLDDVRKRLSKIKGSFSDTVIAERGEY